MVQCQGVRLYRARPRITLPTLLKLRLVDAPSVDTPPTVLSPRPIPIEEAPLLKKVPCFSRVFIGDPPSVLPAALELSCSDERGPGDSILEREGERPPNSQTPGFNQKSTRQLKKRVEGRAGKVLAPLTMATRLMKEFREASQSQDPDIRLSVQDNLYKWTALLKGCASKPTRPTSFPAAALHDPAISRSLHPAPRFRGAQIPRQEGGRERLCHLQP